MEIIFFVLIALFLLFLAADRILLYWLYKHFKDQLPKRRRKKSNLPTVTEDFPVKFTDEERGLAKQHPERIIGIVKPMGFWTELALQEKREELEALLEVDQDPKYQNMGFWQKWSIAGKLLAGRKGPGRGGQH